MTKQDLGGWIALAVALLLGVVAFLLARTYLNNKENEIREELLANNVRMGQVVVATADLLPGDAIGGQTMALAELPAAHISAAAITPDLFNRVAGRALLFPMSEGEPLLSHFVSNEIAGRLSDLLSESERAVTVEVDSVNSHSNLLAPGDMVDIFLLADSPTESDQLAIAGGEQEQRVLQPLLESVRVISVGASPLISKANDLAVIDEQDASYGTVTLAVDVQNAEIITLARDLGELVLLLKNRDDLLLDQLYSLRGEEIFLNNRDKLRQGKSKYFTYIAGSAASTGPVEPVLKVVVTTKEE